MKKSSFLLVQTTSGASSIWIALLSGAALLTLSGPAPAANITTTTSQGAGTDWTAPGIWSSAAAPTAGNTYELISNGTAWGNGTANTRVRNPVVASVTFAGDSLTLNTNTDIRMKNTAGAILNFPGVGGNPGLILNGGVLNPGDDATFVVTGRIFVASSGIFADGDNGGGIVKPARAVLLRGILTGAGPITIVQGHPARPNEISSDSSGFSGDWRVNAGFLRGLTAGSLGNGSNSIFITPTNGSTAQAPTNYCVLEVNYDLSTSGSLVLSNNPVSGSVAQMILHQNCTFAKITINGTV